MQLMKKISHGILGLLMIAIAPPAFSAEPDGEAHEWTFKWDNGFKLTRSDHAFKLKFGGRIMIDGGANVVTGGLRDDFGASGLPLTPADRQDVEIDAKHGSGVEFRRARIFFSGEVYERIIFKAEYDFAQASDADNPDFKDVYLGFKHLAFVDALKLGHFKEPLNLEEATSSKNITFIERGLNAAFFPGRNVGVLATGKAAEGALFWQVGAFRDTNDQGSGFDEWGDGRFDLAGRLAFVPVYGKNGERVVHLAAGYIHRFRSADSSGSPRFRSRPAAHLAQYFVDTQGQIDATDSNILNVEAAFVHGPFSAQAEYTNVWLNSAEGQRDLNFHGYYVFASLFLTGEHRNYQLGKAKFDRVTPIDSFDPSSGKWGAVEVAVRYSALDLVSKGVRGGELWDVTAGINWYLTSNFRWMVDYVHADVSRRTAMFESDTVMAMPGRIRGSSEMILTRIQIDF